MRNHVSEFEAKLKEIDRDTDRIIIINAGSMNHGKSSLFNSLLDREVFKENDIRETVKIQEESWLENVYLVDTPGLNAEKEDDRVAYENYRRANMIVFVHTVKVGELKRAELNAINNIKSWFSDEKFFWDHFCIAFTFLDSVRAQEEIDAIIGKALEDIASVCGGRNIPTFLISNSRYKKGSSENKRMLIEKSGILQLRTYLRHSIPKCRIDNAQIRKTRINREKDELIKELDGERTRLRNKISEKKDRIEIRQRDFIDDLRSAVNTFQNEQSELRSKRARLDRLERELQDLRSQHQREYF